MLKLENIKGVYRESGNWRSTNGDSGDLSGSVTLGYSLGRLSFLYGDGDSQITEPLTTEMNHAQLRGGASVGTVYFGSNSVIVEYDADVNGRQERNTDVWTFLDGTVHRAGVIRQETRMIWFDSVMLKLDLNA